ncbi:ATP-binding sensor histidine kinase [Halioxenophilus aromaticivorans]
MWNDDIDVTETLYNSNSTAVCRGVWKKNNADVILKSVVECTPGDGTIDRIKHEHQILSSLKHPHIVKCLDLQLTEDTATLVLEDISGTPIKDIYYFDGWPVKQFVNIATQLCDILQYIHQKNIIHQDINPANIIVNQKDGRINLIDFGIARQASSEGSLTISANRLEGTLEYLSPEQTGRINRAVDQRSDLYSLGATFYEMLTGRPLFESSSTLELIHSQIAKIPEDLHSINPAIAPCLSSIILKLLRKDSNDRYQTASGLTADLNQFLKLYETSAPSSIQFDLGQQDYSGRLRLPQKLYGRDQETAELNHALEIICRGSKELIFVSGDTGTGKSSFVNELQKSVTLKEGNYCEANFDSTYSNTPYFGFKQSVSALCRTLLSKPAEELAYWQSKISEALGENAGVITGIIPDLEYLIGKHDTTDLSNDIRSKNRLSRTFGQLIKSLCDHKRPLVVCISDIQYADKETLELIEQLFQSEELQYFMLVATFRDQDTPTIVGNHSQLLKSLASDNVPHRRIKLDNLTRQAVRQLLSDSLSKDDHRLTTLANLIYNKTQGNPFFTNHFLQKLYDDKTIGFNTERLDWEWSDREVAEQQFTDNVIDLVTERIEHLSPEQLRVLQMVACIGDSIRADIVAQATQVTLAELLPTLEIFCLENLLVNINQIPITKEDAHRLLLRFTHDRVQQSAYSLISEQDKPHYHLQVARALRENESTATNNSSFQLARHYNLAKHLVTDKAEKRILIEANLIAAELAIKSSAFDSALSHLKTCAEFLDDSYWQEDYELTFNIYIKLVQAAHMSGKRDLFQIYLDIVKANASETDRLQAQQYEILSLTAQCLYTQAVDLTLELLSNLDIPMPDQIADRDIASAIDALNALIGDRQISDLAELPLMTDENMIRAMQVIGDIIPVVYGQNPKLLALLVIKQVELCLSHGNHPQFIYCYLNYAFLRSGMFNDIANCLSFSQLAMSLLTKIGNESDQPRCLFLYNAFIRHWQDPIETCIDSFTDVYDKGIEHGDVEHGLYALTQISLSALVSGIKLDTIAPKMIQSVQTMKHFKMENTYNRVAICIQSVTNIMGKARDPKKLMGTFFDENLIRIQHKDSDRILCFYRSFYTAYINHLLGDYSEAAALLEQANENHHSVDTMYLGSAFAFYESLILLANHGHNKTQLNSSESEKLHANLSQLQLWSNFCPSNFKHKALLVEAMLADVEQRPEQVQSLFEKAIIAAGKSSILSEIAIAYEEAAKYYKRCGLENFYQLYYKKAHQFYSRWGAVVKTTNMELCAPLVFRHREGSGSNTLQSGTQTQAGNGGALLDINSVMKASQAVSSAIVLDDLLKNLMQIVIESAAADRGILILLEEGNWLIQAERSFADNDSKVLQGLPMAEHKEIPLSVLQYVSRTGNRIVLANAACHGNYVNDDYIVSTSAKSILAIPLRLKNELTGILYLENRLTEDVFTSERIQLLEVLSSQIVISIENAKLYHNLERKVEERTSELNQSLEKLQQTQEHLVENEKMASLGRLVAGVAHELNTPIGVCVTATSHLGDESKFTQESLNDTSITKDELEEFLESCVEVTGVVSSNLARASDLISSFKKISVDISTDSFRTFNLYEYLQDVLQSLSPEIKKAEAKTELVCEETIEFTSNPSALTQIITNLIMNALIHAFYPGEEGNITISASETQDGIEMIFQDNGAGMDDETQRKIFEPFFTTNRSSGGTGLGMSILYNLVTHQMRGSISCNSSPGKGTSFHMTFPNQEANS